MNLQLPSIRNCPMCGGRVALVTREGRERPVCASCGHIVYINPVPAAALVVLDKGRVLLTLRNVEPQIGMWCLPGGFIEWGESPDEAARRELLEETGITGGDLSLIGVYDSVSGERLHVLVIAYRVHSWSGDIVPGDDASDVRWFEIDSMPPLAFSVHERALAEALGCEE